MYSRTGLTKFTELYAPASGKVYGQLHERGQVTLLGAPGPALSQELGRLWKREFRSQ